MIDAKVRRDLAKLLGADDLYYGAYIDKETQIQITNHWWAKLGYFHPSQKLLVAVIYTNQAKKGVLIAPYHSSDDSKPSATAIFDVSERDDPVLEALHDIDVAPDESGTFNRGYYFNLYLETDSSSINLGFNATPMNPKLGRLWLALIHTTLKFADICNDEAIISFVDTYNAYTRYKSHRD